MATLSRTETHSTGDLVLYIFTLTSVADTNTFDSGLGNRVVSQWANSEVNEGSQGDEGINVAESSGTFTFYLNTTGTLKLHVFAIGA